MGTMKLAEMEVKLDVDSDDGEDEDDGWRSIKVDHIIDSATI